MSISVIFFLAFCIICTNAGTTQIKRDLSALGWLGGGQEGTDEQAEDSLGSVITFVKTQIRTLIEDMAWEAFKYIRSRVLKFKRKMFKRLGNYTLSDVFHFLFEGVFEFVNDADSELEEHYVKMVPLEPAWQPNDNYSNTHPYVISRLIHSGED